MYLELFIDAFCNHANTHKNSTQIVHGST